ncbi:MAG: hypothetical protein A3I05_07975 [Deltaproteobacteria bacterium RIFCSPLOWO2_02_FULL_44_10]|nr:MAG: hypothetical protein A3C46_01825 [Deltaproteobacteria bacterium RIFCSPHIGHO2_02_FULL_44_16]OGQ45621.1 MAG: hypothetical protein A3I05_07975 [Deltaproteobacteria bacterium RIFCSPLOWO2_02_FULL_44_10]
MSPDTETQELLKLRCELAGFDVLLGFSEAEVQALLPTSIPDVIIIDLTSHDASDKQEAHHIFTHLQGTKTIRVLIAPRSAQEVIDDVESWPVDLIIRKPFELESVVARIEELQSKQHISDNSI